MQFNVMLRTGGLVINREKLRKKRGATAYFSQDVAGSRRLQKERAGGEGSEGRVSEGRDSG